MTEPTKDVARRPAQSAAVRDAGKDNAPTNGGRGGLVVTADELRARANQLAEANDRGQSILTPETTETFRSMIFTLPLADPTEATDRIVSALLNATDLDGLNDPWESDKLSLLLGKRVVIDSLKLLPSRYADGAGFFMLAEGAEDKTGEAVRFATSSWAIMAQLTAAYVRKLLPILVIPAQSETATAAGYFPQHLHVVTTRYRTIDAETAAE